MEVAIIVVMLYGAFTLGGGIIGFVKAKSVPSLVVGSLVGGVLLYAASKMQEGNSAAPYVAVGASILLGCRFFFTWKKNHRAFPDFFMVVLSCITFVVVTTALIAGV